MMSLSNIHLMNRLYAFAWKTPPNITSLPAKLEAVTSSGNEVVYRLAEGTNLGDGLVFENGTLSGSTPGPVTVTVQAFDGVTTLTRAFCVNMNET